MSHISQAQMDAAQIAYDRAMPTVSKPPLISLDERVEDLQLRGELFDPRNVENFGDAMCDWAYSDDASTNYAEVLQLASAGRKDLAFDALMCAVHKFCEGKAKLEALIERGLA